MIAITIKIMRQCIESALGKHKRVHVICIPGNHDESGALWLSAALAHVYERETRVTVETQPSLFAYFEFGKNLIGCHHGHTCKMAQLPGVMAADRSEAWGRTTHRYWYTGHIHTQTVMELPGCVVESFNTLAPNDAYATSGGWRSRENMKAIVLHREHGEVARHTVSPAMLTEVA
jgi:DNA repair exonuclease SbcCD nuclease subunit